jgi:hypothetical protein
MPLKQTAAPRRLLHRPPVARGEVSRARSSPPDASPFPDAAGAKRPYVGRARPIAMSFPGRDQKQMWIADVVLRRAARLVPVELPGPELAIAVDDINVRVARDAKLTNLEFLETVGTSALLKGGFWRDLMRACEMLECPARMPPLVSQYRAALQRVGTDT